MHPHDERPYSFCPMCGGALEPRAIKQNEPERLVCVRCGFVFYLDPKVAVGTIIRDDGGRIALVKRAIEPGYGKWVYPGGYVDRGELVHDAAIREAREESGLHVRLGRLINVCTKRVSRVWYRRYSCSNAARSPGRSRWPARSSRAIPAPRTGRTGRTSRG